MISSTAYYHLCLDSVTEPVLIQAVVKLLISEKCEDNKKVIDIIVERISAGNRVSYISFYILCRIEKFYALVVLLAVALESYSSSF